MNELNVKVGDKVAYCSGGTYSTRLIAKVVRVTPTGRIRIDKSGAQFNKYGKEMGDTYGWNRAYIMELTPQLEKAIIQENTIKKCYIKIREIKSLSYEQAVKILEALDEGCE